MQIDWFTFVAQIVNFLILLVLLKYLLFDRIVKVMDERQEMLTKRQNEADSQRDEAEAERRKYEELRKKVEKDREEVKSRASEEAQEAKKEMMRKARKEVEKKRSEWEQALTREKQEFLDALRNRLAGEIMKITAKVVRDIADEDVQNLAIEQFLGKIKSLEKEEKKRMQQAAGDGADGIHVESAVAIEKARREDISKIVSGLLKGKEVNYSENPSLGLGIELRAGDQRISWSLYPYLRELERTVDEMLSNPGNPNASERNAEENDTQRSEKENASGESEKK